MSDTYHGQVSSSDVITSSLESFKVPMPIDAAAS
jgi:hypothetical protein